MSRHSLIQEKKVYKNSECEFCNNFMQDVELKINPTTNEKIIICADCEVDLIIQLRKDRKTSER